MKQQKLLEEPFPAQLLENINKEGHSLSYVPVGEVIQRLNDVLGVGNWDWEPGRIWRDETDPDWVLAYGQLTATVDGERSTKGGAGGVKIKRKKETNAKDPSGIVDLGDEFKGADSDALKKAAQRFGVGLDLARTKAAREYERPPEPEPSAEDLGWESLSRAKLYIGELNQSVKRKPQNIIDAMTSFRDQNGIHPTRMSFDQYELMRKELNRLTAEEVKSEREAVQEELSQPESVPESPETPQEDPRETIARHFPGAEDLSWATEEELQVVADYEERILDEPALKKKWVKYQKESKLPEKREAWTGKQARQAADFLELM